MRISREYPGDAGERHDGGGSKRIATDTPITKLTKFVAPPTHDLAGGEERAAKTSPGSDHRGGLRS
jgi:hypothetical protein